MSQSLVESSAVDAPRWTRQVLILAAIYNLVWGIAIVLFPRVPFALAGMEPPNYPAIVQCLGMVIGVYGIGYGLAARDPVTQWPLVLVGLLGKVFGPIGFVYAASQGEFPWVAGWMILTNDLVWWLPFTAILVHAARGLEARQAAASGQALREVLEQARTQNGVSLAELSQSQPILVVCVRHLGCTYCREAISDVARNRAAIEAAGARPVIVHMGSVEQGAALVQSGGGGDLDHVSDPQRRVYRALQLNFGTPSELFGLQTVWRAVAGGTVLRHGLGPIVGNVLQMAGVFLIHDGKVLRAYRTRSTADRPDYVELACPRQAGRPPRP